ncbi:MAG: outer membrane beta-barrel protein, partial [Bacteroidota bacterium]
QYNQHGLNLTLRTQLDSMTKLTWRNSMGIRDGLNTSDRFSQSFSTEKILANDGLSNGETNGDRGNLSSNLTVLRRFKKAGRAFTANASFGAQNDQSDLDLFTRNRFYQGQGVAFADSVNQTQGQTVKQITYSGRATYTEPLGKGRYLGANFMHSNFGENSRRDVFDRFPTGESFNEGLSNHFQKDYIYNRGGLSIRINRKKSRFNLGLNYQQSKLVGEIFSQDTLITQDFRNWLPSMRYSYDFGTGKSISFRYNTDVREPSLEQLQPLVNNTDPLNLYLGNPDLQAEYTHSASTQLVIFDQFSFTNLFLNFNLRYTQDKITQSRTIDSLFRQTIQPVNVGQDIVLTSFLNFGTPIKPLKIKLNFDVQTTYNRGIVFVNTIENTTDRWITSSVLSLENRRKDRIDWRVGGELGYNQSQYSVNAELNQSFVNQRYFFDLDINLDKEKKWQFSSQFDYWVYPPSGPFAQAQNIALWEASLGHSFLENNRARIEVVGFDLLNQNIGLNRSNQLNYFEEERVTTLRRYVMLRFTWQLSAFGSQGVQIELNDRR